MEDKDDDWVVQDRDFARFGIDQVRWIPPGSTATWGDLRRCSAAWEDSIVLRGLTYPYHGMQSVNGGELCTLQIRCRRRNYPTVDKKPAESRAEEIRRIAQLSERLNREAELRAAAISNAAAISSTQQFVEFFKSKRLQLEQEEFEAAQKRDELRRLVKQQREQRKANQLIEARQNQPVPVTPPPPEPKPSKGIKRSDLLEYGPSGSRIPGSTLLRDYCIRCHQPMRVVDAGKPNMCLDCNPTGHPGTRTSTVTSGEIQYHGGRFNKSEW